MNTATIDSVTRQHADHCESVEPGQPVRFTEASTVGDAYWQGDLLVHIVDVIPDGYRRITNPTEQDRQLVPGSTQGARHCLDSLDGVELHRPDEWTEEGLNGPRMVLTQERTILHPTHGPVTIPAGFTVGCDYQRVWDAEQRRARRAID